MDENEVGPSDPLEDMDNRANGWVDQGTRSLGGGRFGWTRDGGDKHHDGIDLLSDVGGFVRAGLSLGRICPTQNTWRPMKSLIRNAVSIAVLIVVIGMASLEGAFAQTTSLATQENMQGKVVEIPYITYSDFQSSSLKGDAALSDTQRTDTSGFLNGKTVHELLSVSSLDEAIHFLGKPRTIEKEGFSDGDWVATLQYDEGMFFDYRKYKDGALALLEFELWGSPLVTQGGRDDVASRDED